MEEEAAVLVIDSGSDTTDAGFAGYEAPSCSFPTLVGRPRNYSILTELGGKNSYVGTEAESKRNSLYLRSPFERGIVTNWDDMEKVYHHTFSNELRVDPEEYAVLLTESSLNPKSNRGKMAIMVFETFNIPAFYVSKRAALSLYASERLSGTVVDIGSDVTHITPIFEGYCLPHAVTSVDMGDISLTDTLVRLLEVRGFSFSTSAEREAVTDMKRRLCYVAFDYEHDYQIAGGCSMLERSYELPDGNVIAVDTERFTAPEVLFNPSYGDFRHSGIHFKIAESIMACDLLIRPTLYENIILSGETARYQGMCERMEKEIAALGYSSYSAQVIASERQACWEGGSILASLSNFEKMLISKQEYEETGPSIVHRKWF